MNVFIDSDVILDMSGEIGHPCRIHRPHFGNEKIPLNKN